MKSKKIIRVTTVPQSLRGLLKGQLRFMAEQGFEVVAISSEGPALKEVEETENVRVIAVNMTRSISPISDLKAMYKLYSIFHNERPLIVHTHTPKAGTLGMLAAKLAGVKYRLHTVAGLPLLEEKGVRRSLLDFVEKITYACATKIYPNSEGLYNIILKHNYIGRRKMKVIGKGSSNGIDLDYYNPETVKHEIREMIRRELGIAPDDFLFVFVGRIVGDKGINELVEAYIKMSKEVNGTVKLLLVGPVEEIRSGLLSSTLNEISNNPNIIAVGTKKDVRPYFAISTVLVFPSYREGFPNVVLQAGALGLPSIVSNINGCNEIIKEGQNGLIVEPKNAEALKNAMIYLYGDERLRRFMGNNARRMIADSYDQKVIWREILSEYTSLESKTK